MSTRTDAVGRNAILDAARQLAPHGICLFFKHGTHFHDPLVPAEWEALAREPALDEPAVRRVVIELLAAHREDLAPGIYSPVPIAAGLAAGRPLEVLLEEFRYERIRVDEEQRWTWMGRPVAPRVKAFFLEHLAWQPALGRWYFEYQVNADWWDKSYLDAATTPITAVAVVAEQDGAGCAGEGGQGLSVSLNTGGADRLDLSTLRLDRREWLFCQSERSGEVLLGDALRFSILRHANEACDAVLIAGRWHPLRWPAS